MGESGTGAGGGSGGAGADAGAGHAEGHGGDGAAIWDARLGWAYGLLAEDPAERALALERQRQSQRDVHDAWRRSHDLWASKRTPAAYAPDIDAAALAAHRAYRAAQVKALPEAFWAAGPPPGEVTAWPGLPYALLYLEWEARHPEEWTRLSKHWGTKQSLIRRLAVPDHGPRTRAKLIDLTIAAVSRPYRCKDREYARLARVLDCPELRVRLSAVADALDPWGRVHAGYVLHLMDHPSLPNSRRIWTTWLSGA